MWQSLMSLTLKNCYNWRFRIGNWQWYVPRNQGIGLETAGGSKHTVLVSMVLDLRQRVLVSLWTLRSWTWSCSCRKKSWECYASLSVLVIKPYNCFTMFPGLLNALASIVFLNMFYWVASIRFNLFWSQFYILLLINIIALCQTKSWFWSWSWDKKSGLGHAYITATWYRQEDTVHYYISLENIPKKSHIKL